MKMYGGLEVKPHTILVYLLDGGGGKFHFVNPSSENAVQYTRFVVLYLIFT
jgi:hypothetical protein